MQVASITSAQQGGGVAADEGRSQLWAFGLATTAAAGSLLIASKLYGTFKRDIDTHRSLPGPKQHAIMGNVPQVLAVPVHRQVKAWADEFGPVFVMRFMWRTIVAVTHPETVAKLLRPGPDYAPKFLPSYGIFQRITQPHGLPNILSSPDDAYWRAVRRAVAPAFTTANLRLFFPDVVRISGRMVDHLLAASSSTSSSSTGGSCPAAVDVDGAAQRLTVDVIGQFAFGTDFGASASGFGPNTALQTVSGMLEGMQMQLNPLNRIAPWRKEARFFRHWAGEYDKLVGQLVGGLMPPAGTPPPPATLMARLLQVQDPRTGQLLTREQLKAEAAIFLVAGFETTAHSIAWTLFLLATHPEAEAAVVAELQALGLAPTKDTPTPRPVAWADLGRLRQLDAVITESLRLFPAASGGSARQAPHDLDIEGKRVPKGSMLWMPTWSIHRSQAAWGPDAAEFKPQRWLASGNGAAKPPPAAAAAGAGAGDDSHASTVMGVGDGSVATPDFFTVAGAEEGAPAAAAGSSAGARRGGAFMPFSAGPRDCVGQSLALLELRTALATLLGRARFVLAPEMGGYAGVEAAARQQITLKPMVPAPSGEGPNAKPLGPGLLMHVLPRTP